MTAYTNLVRSVCPEPDCGEQVWSLAEYAGTLRCSSCGRRHHGAPTPSRSRRPMYVRRPGSWEGPAIEGALPLYREAP